tara:strand:+ start:367 stop:501 length:135 start_codon:yes stop_codon:yes gene_type:complete
MKTFKVLTDDNEIVTVNAFNKIDALLIAAKVTKKHWSQIIGVIK